MGNNKKDSDMDYLIAGGVGGFFTRIICQPLDVIKIRFQLQVEPIQATKDSKYHSILQAFQVIAKEEGPTAFWKGHVPAQILSIIYGMGQFYSYHILIEHSKRYPKLADWKNSIHFASGAMAGCVATFVSFPFDTIRTRLIAQSSNKIVYSGLFHSSFEILKKESPRGFFRGLTPSLIQIAPNTGAQFLFYELFTANYMWYFHHDHITATNSFLSGSMTGFLVKSICYPFDLIRKRMQLQGFEHAREGFGEFPRSKGMIDCVIFAVKKEGFSGLFKGLIPSQIKAAMMTALYFTFYEQYLQLLHDSRHT